MLSQSSFVNNLTWENMKTIETIVNMKVLALLGRGVKNPLARIILITQTNENYKNSKIST